MSTGKRIVRNDGEGDKRWFYGGGLHTWKLTAEDTGGSLVLFEDHMTEGKVTPLHRHPQFDEMLYVLEGSILIQIDGEDQPVGAGGTTFAPRGVPHAFTVTSPMVRLLCMQTPGSGQPFYEGASDPTTQTDPTGPVDFDRVRQAATDSGATEILGPPPFTARSSPDRLPRS